MNTTTVMWRAGMHFCTKLRSGDLMCDESSEVGDAYPSSPELLMASLGSCIASVLVLFADHHGLDLEGMEIDLTWEMAENPHRIGKIDISVRIPRHVASQEKVLLERVAHTCLIHNTLTHPPALSMTIASPRAKARPTARKARARSASRRSA
jgi:putative redox protein